MRSKRRKKTFQESSQNQKQQQEKEYERDQQESFTKEEAASFFAEKMFQLILKKRWEWLIRLTAFFGIISLFYTSYVVYNWPLFLPSEKKVSLLGIIYCFVIIGGCITDIKGNTFALSISLKVLDIAQDGQNRFVWGANMWATLMSTEILFNIPALWAFSSFLNILQLWSFLGLSGEKSLLIEPTVALICYFIFPKWFIILLANSTLYALLVMWVILKSEKKFWDLGVTVWICLILFDVYWRKILYSLVWIYSASYCMCFGLFIAWAVLRYHIFPAFLENHGKLNFFLIYLLLKAIDWSKNENKLIQFRPFSQLLSLFKHIFVSSISFIEKQIKAIQNQFNSLLRGSN